MVKQYKGYKGEAQQYLVLFSLGLQPVLLLGGQPVVVVLAVALPLISGSGRTSTGHLGLGLVAAEALQHFRLGSVVVVGFFGLLFLGLFLGSGRSSSATTGGGGSRSGDSTTTSSRHGSQLGASLGDQGLEVLACELGDDLVKKKSLRLETAFTQE